MSHTRDRVFFLKNQQPFFKMLLQKDSTGFPSHEEMPINTQEVTKKKKATTEIIAQHEEAQKIK